MEDYEEIRRDLVSKREEMLGRLSALTHDARHPHEPLDPDFEEQAVERQNDEVMDALDAAARRELAQIERALERMERGEYAACALCGEAIPVARLRALPYTDRCVDCAELDPA